MALEQRVPATLAAEIEKVDRRADELTAALAEASALAATLADQRSSLARDLCEDLNRCRNLILTNIPEPVDKDRHHRGAELEKAVRSIIQHCTPATSAATNRIHRVGEWAAGGCRPTLVEFRTPADRDAVLQGSRQLRCTGWSAVGIVPDRPSRYPRPKLRDPAATSVVVLEQMSKNQLRPLGPQ